MTRYSGGRQKSRVTPTAGGGEGSWGCPNARLRREPRGGHDSCGAPARSVCKRGSLNGGAAGYDRGAVSGGPLLGCRLWRGDLGATGTANLQPVSLGIV
jgi:hypothetical protein